MIMFDPSRGDSLCRCATLSKGGSLMPKTPKGYIEHANLTVSNPDRSAELLKQLMGWQERWRDWAGGETREIGRWTTNGSERGPQSDPPAADPGAADPATADPATDPEPDPLSSDRDSAPES